MYSQSSISVHGAKVDYIAVKFTPPECQPPSQCILSLDSLQTYEQELVGCMIVGSKCMPFQGKKRETFTDGRFNASRNNQGSEFIPRASDLNNPINDLLKIRWCPDQNYFLVELELPTGPGTLLKPLRHYQD